MSIFDYRLANGTVVDERRIVTERFTPRGQQYTPPSRGVGGRSLYGPVTKVTTSARGTTHHYAEPVSDN